MNIDNLIWYQAGREEIPEMAFGSGALLGRGSVLMASSSPQKTAAHVAYSGGDSGSFGYRPPALFILREEDASDTLSWLRVYAKEAFPLSQFARVITDSDWDNLYSKPSEGLTTRTDKWASVVLGEILGQGEAEADIESIPLSRASGCFSMAIARSNYVHDAYPVTRACVDRLRVISEDGRIAKRLVPIDSLTPIWALVSANVEDTPDLNELTEIVILAVERVERSKSDAGLVRKMLASTRGLSSDSVEERVVAFQQVAKEAVLIGDRRSSTVAAAALLAMAAFLVGRGTSHAFLLRKFPGVAPAAFAWFGLIAALKGSQGWDSAWTRMVKGIERQLRASFCIQDPPMADICWTEYSWLTKSFSGGQGLSDLARLFPRSLSIEIVPGAVCQFRMSSETRTIAEERRPEPSGLELELRNALERILLVADEASVILKATSSTIRSTPRQEGLALDARTSPSKVSRSKKPYKRSEK